MKKLKFIQSEIEKSIQGTNSEGKENWTQINDLEQREEINIQPEQNEESREFKKIRKALGTHRTTLNVPISESQGWQKEKGKGKKWKTHYKK